MKFSKRKLPQIKEKQNKPGENIPFLNRFENGKIRKKSIRISKIYELVLIFVEMTESIDFYERFKVRIYKSKEKII